MSIVAIVELMLYVGLVLSIGATILLAWVERKSIKDLVKVVRVAPVHGLRIRYSEEDFWQFVKATVDRHLPLEYRQALAQRGTVIGFSIDENINSQSNKIRHNLGRSNCIGFWKTTTGISGGSGWIHIDSRINPLQLADTIIHEMAHCFTTEEYCNGHEEAHGEMWQSTFDKFGGSGIKRAAFNNVRWNSLPSNAWLAVGFNKEGKAELLTKKMQFGNVPA